MTCESCEALEERVAELEDELRHTRHVVADLNDELAMKEHEYDDLVDEWEVRGNRLARAGEMLRRIDVFRMQDVAVEALIEEVLDMLAGKAVETP